MRAVPRGSAGDPAALGADDDQVAYDLAEWPPEDRVIASADLVELGIPYRWEDNLTLVVPAGAETEVDAILDEIDENAATDESALLLDLDTGEDGGEEATVAMSDLFIAADGLQHGTYDEQRVVVFMDAAAAVADCLPPFGIEKQVWTRVQTQAAAIVNALEKGEDDDGTADAAKALRGSVAPVRVSDAHRSSRMFDGTTPQRLASAWASTEEHSRAAPVTASDPYVRSSFRRTSGEEPAPATTARISASRGGSGPVMSRCSASAPPTSPSIASPEAPAPEASPRGSDRSSNRRRTSSDPTRTTSGGKASSVSSRAGARSCSANQQASTHSPKAATKASMSGGWSITGP